ncbi:UDP-glucose/GDP-mannose dehydrogenase family protein [Paenibacillus campi]|uniref:UDP-glucose dehydrogenase family protein n=1 Tax=Paenibacillus campi TaxID=3106031 RepID=UPI002AFE6B2B|nr:UDP-glucose/GDP-mannose dehydrogenase family protein [Paenibacillus sp. SGZ-1009]
MNITVVGTGYVGLVTGAVLADLGHYVTCLDVDTQKIALLKQGISPIYEPGLSELVYANLQRQRMVFTTDYKMAYEQAQVIFIAVGTPQNDEGAADLRYVEQVIHHIAQTVDHDVIVVMKSTVPVGTNDWVEAMLQSNKQFDVQIQVVSNPEFLREGFALQDSYHGDRLVIGAETQAAGDQVQSLFAGLDVPVVRTDRRSSEMIKYASNAFLAVKITYINEIANLCEKLDVNVLEVANAMGMDKRIGRAFLRPGIGYGGSCFPKDTEAIAYLGRQHHTPLTLVESTIQANFRQRELFLQQVLDYFDGHVEGKTIAMLGLAFKPDTDDLREAPSLYLLAQLEQRGAIVKAYDPVVKHLQQCVATKELALQGSQAVLLVTEWAEFGELDLEDVKLFDGRYMYSRQKQKGGVA